MFVGFLLLLQRLGPEALHLGFGVLHLLALLLQLGEHVLKVLVVLAQRVLRLLQDCLGQAQAAGDGEGIGLARHTEKQPVRRLKSLHVKLARRVVDAVRVKGVDLELGVMGSRCDPATRLAAVFD